MNIISWIGTATSIAGSFLVALHIFILGYVAFLIGSICWGFTAVKNKDNPLLPAEYRLLYVYALDTKLSDKIYSAHTTPFSLCKIVSIAWPSDLNLWMSLLNR
jgi:drug/metabolite transporter (DMT)-like permease